MNSETTFGLRVPVDINRLHGHKTAQFILKPFSWCAETKEIISSNGVALGIFLHCIIEEPSPSDWACIATAKFHLVSPQPNIKSIEREMYYMEFNPNTTKRGYEHFVLLKDLHRFVQDKKIHIHIDIRTIGISKSSNLVHMTTLSIDEHFKIRATFRDIHTIYGAISPEFQYNGFSFNLCIFKRPFERDEHRYADALWLYLCCRKGNNERVKWAFKILLLTNNEQIGPLTAEYNDVEFSKAKDSYGAPFIALHELYDGRNQYMLTNDSITFEFHLHAFNEQNHQQNHEQSLMFIKTEPQSPPPSPEIDVSLPEIYAHSDPNKRGIKRKLVQYEEENTSELVPISGFPYFTRQRSQNMNGNTHNRTNVDELLKCNLCSNNLFDDDVIAMKCGHLYCKICFKNDIISRKMCIKCNTNSSKEQCGRVYLNDEHQKNCLDKRIGTRANSLLRSFNFPTDEVDSDNRNQRDLHVNCPLCQCNLLEVDTYVTECGHLYCKNCLEKDIAMRKMCIVCNKTDSKCFWIPILFS